AQAVDLVVDRGVLLDVEVLRRDVGLRLVVVVVGDEVLDRVVGEELAELVAELRRKGLVVRDHQARALHLGDRRRHREGLAGAGRAQQGLEAFALAQALGQAGDRLRLVRRRGVGGVQLEIGHIQNIAGAYAAPSMKLSRTGVAALFTFTGVMHFVRPRFFEAIVPPAIEAQKQEAVAVSGVAEIAGAAFVLHPASRRLGRWWLLALL